MIARRRSLVLLMLILILTIPGCGPGKLFGPTLTPTQTPTSTPTVTPSPTPTRDPSIPYGLILKPVAGSPIGNMNYFDAYNSAIPQAWKVPEGGTPLYYIKISDVIGADLGYCNYQALDSNGGYNPIHGFEKAQHNLSISLWDYASDEMVTYLTVEAPALSSEPCPYIYDAAWDFYEFSTLVNVESFVTGLFELVQPIQAELPPATVDQALAQTVNPSPTQTPVPVDSAAILNRVCDPQSGNCGMFIALDITQPGTLEWVSATIEEYYQISPVQYTLLVQKIKYYFLTQTTYEGCKILDGAGDCLDRTLQTLRISPCYLVTDWYLGTFTQPDPSCTSIYLVLPAAGANSGQTIFDPADLEIAGSAVVNISRENMQAALEEVFPH